MSDDTPTTPDTTTETAAARPRRRRAAGRPAGPPAEVPTGTEPTTAPAAEAAADAVPAEKAAPAKKTAKKAAAKRPSRAKKAAPAPEEPAADAPVEPSHVAALPAVDAPSTEPEPARKRSRSRKVAVPAFSAVQEPEAAEVPVTEHSAAGLLMFQAPTAEAAPPRRRKAAATPEKVETAEAPAKAARSTRATKATKTAKAAQQVVPADEELDDDELEAAAEGTAADTETDIDTDDEQEGTGPRRRRRRGGRGRRRKPGTGEAGEGDEPDEGDADTDDQGEADDDEQGSGTSRRRRRRRRRGNDGDAEGDDPPNTVVRVREPRQRSSEVTSVKGSTRLEAKKQRRREGREAGRRRPSILTEAEFLARREAVDRVMVVRQRDDRTQIAVLEDGVLVEHYVNRSTGGSMIGNVYLGKVQNVLPSMEAAFVDVGRGRNAVLYAGEVNWDAAGLGGQPKRIEAALKSGDPVLVQVSKDPVGHKGARLTAQISLPGRFLVYVPESSMTGISRKLPDTERSRLKSILRQVVPEDGGVIVRTAAEGASEDELRRDVERLAAQWEEIKTKAAEAKGGPALLHGEPDLAIKVVRDIFNEDFGRLVVEGDGAWTDIEGYVTGVAPDLAERVEKWVGPGDLFTEYRIDEQLAKALDRKVYLPSGGSLVIDRTEAMTVVDVNTGKFTGQGGNLEETVTKNNLEAAEEIVRQLRLRDIGGIVVVDFIDMVLESNRDLVLRRLLECLGRDRTKHQVAEVTSLGLVQMTRKRIGQGLLEVFAEPCEACQGRGYHVHSEPVVAKQAAPEAEAGGARRKRRGEGEPEGSRRRGAKAPAGPAVEVEPRAIDPTVSAAMEKIHAAAAKRAADAAAGIDVDAADAADVAGDAPEAVEPVVDAPEAPQTAAQAHVGEPEASPSAATAAARPVKRTRRKATRKAGPAAVDDV